MHSSKWLALESSTDTLSLALAHGTRLWTHTREGGALTSTQMIPQTLALLQQANVALSDLQAVVFGRGPGSFTGLRTACAVAQGLALGADLPVLPIDTLLALAEETRVSHAAEMAAVATDALIAPVSIAKSPVTRVLAVLDARMAQVYVAAYEFTPNRDEVTATSLGADSANSAALGTWRCVQAPALQSPDALFWPAHWGQGASASPSEGSGVFTHTAPNFIAAGNAWAQYADRWPEVLTVPQVWALPTASALLRLAPAAWAAGAAVPPEEALPLYIRDKVAQTTNERLRLNAQQATRG